MLHATMFVPLEFQFCNLTIYEVSKKYGIVQLGKEKRYLLYFACIKKGQIEMVCVKKVNLIEVFAK